MFHRKRFNQISGIVLLIGAGLYKAQYIPFPIVSLVFRILALCCYFIGCFFWLLAFRHEEIKSFDNWTWLSPEHSKHFLAAAVGLVATILCFCSIVNPICMIIGLWLYVASDLIWSAAEYDQLNNVANKNYSAQKATLLYAISLTLIAVTLAIASCFPPSLLLLCVSGGICVALGVFAFFFYMQSQEKNHQPIFDNSYEHITKNLGTKDNSITIQNIKHPGYGKSLFAEPNNVDADLYINEDKSCFPSFS